MKGVFLRRFLANPRRVGSIMPSSRQLARSMLGELPFETAHTVVEFGPGIGTFTAHINERLPPDADFFAVEIDPVFAEQLRERFPRLRVIEDSAEYIANHVAKFPHGGADIVVSGLPFANLPLDFCARVLDGVQRILRPGGHFVTYQYLHARAFSSHLEDSICAVFPDTVVRFTLGNLPPAFVFHARA